MTVFIGVLLSVIAFVTAAVVIGGAIWAARKDGEEDLRHRRRFGR
jgi:hypothetical protein